LLTQCPNCQTTFRVTSEILRVAEGQVRCGRCQTQFDALERLIDEAEPGAEVQTSRFLRPPRPMRRPDPSTIEVEEPDEQEDITLEGRHIEISGTYRVTDDANAFGEAQLRQETTEEWVEIEDLDPDPADDPTAQTGTFEPLSEEIHTEDEAALEEAEYAADNVDDVFTDATDATDAEDAQYRDISYRDGAFAGNDAAADDAFANDPFERAALANSARKVKPAGDVRDVIARAAAAAAALRNSAAVERKEPVFATPPRRFASRGQAAPAVEDELDILNPRARMEDTQPQATILKWKWLIAPLALVLIVQIIHHYRSDLARHPQIGAPLMNVYGALRLPLTPEWELHSYEIKQWGVLSDPATPGTLKVRASITNRANFAQPYPLLKLVLEDRWGDQVRAREFEPTEYLDPGTAADRLLGPQQQTSAIVNIVDPGPDAEGFRFDVCLRGRAGPVCAADIPE
jgi:predicted Zn finger-like uncharacterized protein